MKLRTTLSCSIFNNYLRLLLSGALLILTQSIVHGEILGVTVEGGRPIPTKVSFSTNDVIVFKTILIQDLSAAHSMEIVFGDGSKYVPYSREFFPKVGDLFSNVQEINFRNDTGVGRVDCYTFEVQRRTDIIPLVPSSVVVIPTEGTGNVEIVLESSVDLVTWTLANPGTYGRGEVKRFFRVRAIGN